MKFTYLDYYILCEIQKGGNLEDIVTRVCERLPAIPLRESLETAFGKLTAEGFAVLEGGKISITDKTRVFLKKKSIFESKNKYDISRIETMCSMDAKRADFSISETVYGDMVRKVQSTYEIRPCLSLDGDTLFIGGEAGGSEDNCVSSSSFSCEITNGGVLAKNLLCVCNQLTSPSKARKITLDSPDASYILTMSQDGSSLILKAQKILFNRKRFSGKLNSDLDYAQCGDTILQAACPLTDFLSCAALVALKYEDSFTTEDYQKLMNIAI